MERFEKSVRKLYNAFVSGELDAMDCSACAAGNLCANKNYWSSLRDKLGIPLDKNDIGALNLENYLKITEEESNYTFKEIIEIESIFLNAMGYYNLGPKNIDNYNNKTKEDKEHLNFLGLCAVIDYLAHLDNIENPIQFKQLLSGQKKLEDVF